MPVPTTGTKLSDITAEVTGTQTSLQDCVDDAYLPGLDGGYYVAPLDSIRDFRGYVGGDTEPPTAPVLSSGITGGIYQDLNWTASTDNIAVSGYFVQYRLDSDSYGASIDVGNVLLYTVTGLDDGSQYWYRVQARDTSGNYSAWSNSITETTYDETPPTEPVLSENVVTDVSVSVTWLASTDNVGVVGYRLSKDGGFVTNVGSGTLAYTFVGLSSSTTYTLGVKAYDNDLNYSTEDTISSTTDDPPLGLGLSDVLIDIPAQDSAVWTNRTFDATAYIGATVRLVIESIPTSDGYVGDNQVDDILFGTNDWDPEDGLHSFQASISSASASYAAQPWLSLTDGTSGPKWLRKSGVPSSTGTGIAAHTGTYHYYTETSGTTLNTAMWLRSPEVVLTSSLLDLWTAQAGAECGEINIYIDVVSVPGPPDTEDPTDPVISLDSKTSNSIQVDWTASTDNVGVNGYRLTKGGVFETNVGSGTLTYNFTGLTGNTAYTLGVSAYDAAGNYSNEDTLNETTDVAPALVACRVSNSADFDIPTVCAYTAYTTRYCAVANPTIGDTVYEDAAGLIPYNGGTVRWRLITNYGYLVKIGSDGVVDDTDGGCG